MNEQNKNHTDEKIINNEINDHTVDNNINTAEINDTNAQDQIVTDIGIKKKLIRKKKTIGSYIKKFIILCVGACLYAAGLEIFLIPNQIIDGGVVGISIMASYLTDIEFSVFMLTINLPFLYTL